MVVAGLNGNVNAQEIQWHDDLASATKIAAEQNKLVLMHFTAEWCRPCNTLDTFVFTNQSVQRAFAQNVVAVKIDVDHHTDLVQEYGVEGVPYDVAITPSGRIVSKRKSPRDASAYGKMITDFHSIIADLTAGKSPALAQNLSELQELMQNKNPKFAGQPASFTPEAPSYHAPQASAESAELKRRSQIISNPYAAKPAPQRVANAFMPGQELNAPMSQNSFGIAPAATKQHAAFAPQNFAPKSFAPKNFAPSQTTQGQFAAQPQQNNGAIEPLTQYAPAAPQAPPAQQQVQVNPFAAKAPAVPSRNVALQRLEQSEVAAKLIREKAQRKLDAFRAEPKVVMDDKFFGAPSAKQVEERMVAGNYQAKISLPKGEDFLPPDPPSFASPTIGEANARIVVDHSRDDNSFQRPRTKAMMASASSISSAGPSNPIEMGLDLASTTVRTPKYALHGKCPVTLLQQSKWVNGNPKIGCVHRNRIYIFTNEKNRELFQADPDAHSPILAGYDPVVFQETGKLVDGLEKHGVFMGKPPHQRIVLFATAETRAKFQAQPKKYLEAVRQAMRKTGASSDLIR